MGTPREPIELVARVDGVPPAGEHVRLLGVRSGEDWTDRMQAWARERVRALMPLRLSGFVLKAGSPSCGVRGVPVHAGNTQRAGRGLFAQALVDAMPDLPVADEEGLAQPAGLDDFLRRVRAHHERP